MGEGGRVNVSLLNELAVKHCRKEAFNKIRGLESWELGTIVSAILIHNTDGSSI